MVRFEIAGIEVTSSVLRDILATGEAMVDEAW
jgi:hypothetical protein